jgi:hypothetical protein
MRATIARFDGLHVGASTETRYGDPRRAYVGLRRPEAASTAPTPPRPWSSPTRWFGYVAGGLATLSVLSLAFYYASVLLPVGRVLAMVWTVIAAIVLARSGRTGLPSADGGNRARSPAP